MGFLVMILACIINGAFFLYFSMTSSFWVFFSSVCFFSSLFALCFSKSNFIWFSLYTVCLSIPDWFVQSFMLLGNFVKTWCFACHVFRAWLITAFALLFNRFKLVVGRLDFAFFWWKQHLICTDQNVSATITIAIRLGVGLHARCPVTKNL